jgi:adenylate cyclase
MRRRLPLILPLLVLILGVALRYWDPGVLRDARYRTFDLLQQLNPRPYEASLPVRIVALDELSLSRYGQWPWPRTLMAQLTDKLREAGVAAIAFDVLFAEPDRSSPKALLQQLPPGPARDALEAALGDGSLYDSDEVFAQALARAPSVLAFAFTNEPSSTRLVLPKGGVSFKGKSPLPYIYRFPGALMPLGVLADAAPGLGTIRVIRDSDGTQRRVMLVAAIAETSYPDLEVTQRIYPSLALEALRVAAGGPNILMKAADDAQTADSGYLGVQAIKVGKGKGYVIETQPQGEIWLWDSGSQPERYISASAVLDGTADLAKLKGNIVFFGTTAAGLYDNLATPLDPAMPGVELHAQITEQMLTGTFLSRPWWADPAEKVAVALVGLLIWLCFVIRGVGAFWAAILGGVLVGAGFAAAWYAFTVEHFLLDPVTPSAIGLLVYATAGIAGYLTSERQRREVRAAFGQYVSPDVVARIADNPTRVSLGGEARELTLLFCDVRGFTTLSEKLDPQALTRLINRFLTEMSDALLRSGGTIDKYMGDCVMGFWNAPLDVPHHPARACEAVLDMRRRLVALNEALAKEGDGGLKLGVGIGVNSGNCSVGNMGSAQRLAYTAVGDNVNLASRLEGLTRLYGVDCLVSEAVTLDAPDFTFLEVDRIRVKGRVQPVTVFALLGHSGELGQDSLAAVLGVKAFLEAFRAGDWAAAEAALANLVPILDGTPLAGLLPRYRDRLDEVKDKPAPDGWDGVYTAREK